MARRLAVGANMLQSLHALSVVRSIDIIESPIKLVREAGKVQGYAHDGHSALLGAKAWI